jgi:hypothetical protein
VISPTQAASPDVKASATLRSVKIDSPKEALREECEECCGRDFGAEAAFGRQLGGGILLRSFDSEPPGGESRCAECEEGAGRAFDSEATFDGEMESRTNEEAAWRSFVRGLSVSNERRPGGESADVR